jgi:replicative DNA helicase
MAEQNLTKIPPNSKESEMIVLGCMLTSIGSLNIAADSLDEQDFYYTEHKIIFEVLKGCFVQDKPADVHLVAEELKRRNQLKAIGGIAYLTTVAQYAGTAAHIEEYTDLVRNKSLLRRMIHSAQEIEKQAFDNPDDVQTSLDAAQQKFFQISQSANTLGGILIKDIISGAKASSKLPYLKELQEKQEKFQARGPDDTGITGIPTHFLEFDKMINGLSPSNLMILAARPAMGKTALALNIAENVCFKNNLPVGIFSLEMTADQLLHRIICSQAEVESDKIKTGSLNGIEFQRIVGAVNTMQKHTMIIDDQPGLKITDLRARARRMREAYGIEFLVIDYLQLLSGSGSFRNQENRQLEVSEISRLLKTLARELNIPILCLSQLSRKVEERAGHRPMMSDLRESGCLSGDAQIKDADTGQIYTIKELAERRVQKPILVYGVDKDLKVGKHRMIKAFYSGKKVVYELKTRTGRSIKASANHPFLKLGVWSRLDSLTPGDKIALPRSLNEKRISPNELVLWGHLLRDGCILPISTVPSNRGYRPMYHIGVQGSTNQKIFLEKVGCSGKRGEIIPQLLEQLNGIKPNPNYDIIPKEAWNTVVKDAKTEFKLGWRDVCKGLNTSYCGSTLFKPGISRQRIKTLPQVLPSKELAESDVYWDEILSITELGTEDVYDATVENVHNFVANDIIVHNSLEQDSDLVMFLLRREYYDPYDKPGTAELIVAKNRHGGIGSVNLAFRKELAQFGNYAPIRNSNNPNNEAAFSAFSPN